jgi:hypothetical protein
LSERFVFDEVNFTQDPGYLGIQIGREDPRRVRVVKRRWLVFIISLAFLSLSILRRHELGGDQQRGRDYCAKYH